MSADPFDFGPPDVPAARFGAADDSQGSGTTRFDDGGDDAWGDEQADRDLAVASPPVIWLFAASGLALVGLLLAILLGGIPIVAGIAWVAAGPAAIGLLSIFILRDTKQRAMPLYSSESWVGWLYYGALALAFIGIVASALQLANWVGRL